MSSPTFVLVDLLSREGQLWRARNSFEPTPLEKRGQRRSDIAETFDDKESTSPCCRDLATELLVLLARGVEHDVHTRQPSRRTTRIPTGVVDAVREQNYT